MNSQQEQQVAATEAAIEEARKIENLNNYTQIVTAFGNWAEFKQAMTEGYTPTIRVEKLRKNASKLNRYLNNVKYVLREMVRMEGFKVFDGKTVA